MHDLPAHPPAPQASLANVEGLPRQPVHARKRAVPQFQEAIRLNRTHAELHYLLARTYQKLKRLGDFRRELEVAQKVQATKREEAESLVGASGARGDPARGLGLVPPSAEKPSPPRP